MKNRHYNRYYITNKNLFFLAFILVFLLAAFTSYAFSYGLILRGSMSEMYDDNITASSENEEFDFITNFTLGLGINHETKSQSLEFIGHIFQQIYNDHKELNNNSQDLRLTYINQITNYDNFHLTETFHHYPEPRHFENIFGRSGGRVGYYNNRFEMTYTKDVIREFTLITRYTNELNKYISSDLNDSYLNRAGSEANFQISSTNTIYTYYDFTYITFSNNEYLYLHTTGLGDRFNLTRNLFVGGRAGMNFIRYYNKRNIQKPYYYASFVYELNENNTINISFTKQYAVTALAPEPYKNWWIRGNLNRQISNKLSIIMSTFYGEGEYTATDTKTKLLGVESALSYDIKDNISCSMRYIFTRNEYNYIQITGDDTTEEREMNRGYKRNTINLVLTAEF